VVEGVRGGFQVGVVIIFLVERGTCFPSCLAPSSEWLSHALVGFFSLYWVAPVGNEPVALWGSEEEGGAGHGLGS